jgi:hypothetical protein
MDLSLHGDAVLYAASCTPPAGRTGDA